MLKKSYLCRAISVAKFCGIKESALTLVEIANLKKYKQGTEQLIYVGCLSVCLYERLAMLTSGMDGSPLSISINIVE